MKRFLLIFFIVMFLAVGTILLLIKVQPQKAIFLVLPDFRDLRQLSLEVKGDSLLAQPLVVLKNNGFFRMHTKQLKVSLRVDQEQLLAFTNFRDIDLPPREKTALEFPIKIPLKKIRDKIEQMQGRDSFQVALKGEVLYSTFFGSFSAPVHKQISLPVPIPPRFELKKIRLKKIKWSSILLNVEVVIQNPGNLNLHLTFFKLHALLKGGLEVEENQKFNVDLKAGENEKIVIPLLLKAKTPFPALKLAVEANKPIHYTLVMQGLIQSDRLFKGEVPFILKSKGDLDRAE